MTARDRIVLIVVGFVAVAAGFWFLAISPKRKDAAAVTAQIAAAQERLDTAQRSATDAQAAVRRYDTDYATVARLGKAVPVDDDVPSLVYQLNTIADSNHIDFRSIKLSASASPVSTAANNSAAIAAANGNTSGATASASAASTALPPGATVGSAGFPTMPFTFDFTGSYFRMQNFVRGLDRLTRVNKRNISVRGRLLTLDGFQLKAAPAGFPRIEATVAATAYLLPSDEGLTAGATPQSPSAATASGSTTASASLIANDR